MSKAQIPLFPLINIELLYFKKIMHLKKREGLGRKGKMLQV